MKSFRQLKDTNNMAKTRIRKLSSTGKYYSMEKSNPDKTNFNRPPYYLTVGKKENWKEQMMCRFVRVQ